MSGMYIKVNVYIFHHYNSLPGAEIHYRAVCACASVCVSGMTERPQLNYLMYSDLQIFDFHSTLKSNLQFNIRRTLVASNHKG